MEKQWVICQRRRVLLICGVGIICFAMGWTFQSGWVKTTPPEKPQVSLEVTPPVRPVVVEEKGKNVVSFRLDRDREQSRQRERLQELLLAAESGSEWAKKVESELLTLERRINFEHDLENLLATRGYPDAAVSVNEGAVTVVIGDKKLQPEQVSLIGQWTADVTGFPIAQIRIVDKP